MDRFLTTPAAAHVRARLDLPDRLADRPLASLSPTERTEIVELGLAAGLDLHRFKRTLELPRVRRVLGILHGLAPIELLDVGSGRGAFLWPLVETFPGLPILAIDLRDDRVSAIAAISAGGVDSLEARLMDATALDLPDDAFDVATALEVLEHIPAIETAVAEIVRVARRFVVASVPSKPDENPEHIHLLSPADLSALFESAGALRVQVLGVPNHRVVVARCS